jgi:cell division protein FtsB
MAARPAAPPLSPVTGQLKRAKKFQPKPVRASVVPRVVRWALLLLSAVIIIDALFGDRGLLDTMRAHREFAALEAHVARVRAENVRLRAQARRLKEDPLAIESIARDQLGLIYPGETLFIVKAVPLRRR